MNSKIIKAAKMVGVYITWVGPNERLFFVSISSSIVRTNYQKMNFTLYIFIYLNSYLPKITSIHTVSKNTFKIINCINIRNVEGRNMQILVNVYFQSFDFNAAIVTHDYLTTIKFAHLIKQGKIKPDYLYFSNGQLYLSVGYSLLHIALLIMNDVGFIFVHRLSFFFKK